MQYCLETFFFLVPPQERDGFGGALGPRGRGRGRADWNMAPGGLQEVTYTIPADKCGLVIGKGSAFLCVLHYAILCRSLKSKWQVKTCPGVRILASINYLSVGCVLN